MSPIVTITFGPCLDKSFEVDRLVPDSKLGCSDVRVEPGGGGINVARAVHRLGGRVLAVYPSGGCLGDLLNSLLSAEGVAARPIPLAAEIRENVNVWERTTSSQYRFICPPTPLPEDVWQACLDAISEVEPYGYLVISGSLPGQRSAELFAKIKGLTKARHIHLVVDSSGQALQEALLAGVYLVKPSKHELETLARVCGLNVSSPILSAMDIIRHGWAEVVLMSAGSEGAVLVTRNGIFSIHAPAVPKRSTVGAGDSLVAGTLLALTRNMDIRSAAQYGVACGTAAIMHKGTALFDPKEADALFARIKTESLNHTFS